MSISGKEVLPLISLSIVFGSNPIPLAEYAPLRCSLSCDDSRQSSALWFTSPTDCGDLLVALRENALGPCAAAVSLDKKMPLTEFQRTVVGETP